jgi:hypothetical protein
VLTLTISASLSALVGSAAGNNSIRSVQIEADDWTMAVAAIRAQFPRLAERVFTDTGRIRPGFLVAVNDVVSSCGEEVPDIRPGDEVFMFVQIAGG